MLKTFRGGLHIRDYKEYTNKKPIKEIEGGEIHIFPLQQHIGAPLEATVKKGDYVKVGEIIADNKDAFVAVPLHSSVSGTVIAVEPRLNTQGIKAMAVVIENDGLYEEKEDLIPKNPEEMTSEEIIGEIRNAGIVGMGGAGFPTHVKLSPPKDKIIDTLIINGAECEPYITADHRRMLEMPEVVIDGIKIVKKALGVDIAYIGIENNKKDAIEILNNNIEPDSGIKVIPLKTKYPQGGEKQLIYAITKRKVPTGKLPADAGVVVTNIDTVSQISNSFRTGMPLIDRVVTVSGDCIAETDNFMVRCGMRFEDVINAAGGFSKQPNKLIMGGPMMGVAQHSIEVPVVKTTSAILALSDTGDNYKDDLQCLRCGKCVEACPMNLMPLYLNRYSRNQDLEMAEKYHIMDCIECGLCSYLCPGLEGPIHNIRIAKQQIIENRRKQQ